MPCVRIWPHLQRWLKLVPAQPATATYSDTRIVYIYNSIYICNINNRDYTEYRSAMWSTWTWQSLAFNSLPVFSVSLTYLGAVQLWQRHLSPRAYAEAHFNAMSTLGTNSQVLQVFQVLWLFPVALIFASTPSLLGHLDWSAWPSGNWPQSKKIQTEYSIEAWHFTRSHLPCVPLMRGWLANIFSAPNHWTPKTTITQILSPLTHSEGCAANPDLETKLAIYQNRDSVHLNGINMNQPAF